MSDDQISTKDLKCSRYELEVPMKATMLKHEQVG